jgi:hypothetical protein
MSNAVICKRCDNGVCNGCVDKMDVKLCPYCRKGYENVKNRTKCCVCEERLDDGEPFVSCGSCKDIAIICLECAEDKRCRNCKQTNHEEDYSIFHNNIIIRPLLKAIEDVVPYYSMELGSKSQVCNYCILGETVRRESDSDSDTTFEKYRDDSAKVVIARVVNYFLKKSVKALEKYFKYMERRYKSSCEILIKSSISGNKQYIDTDSD